MLEARKFQRLLRSLRLSSCYSEFFLAPGETAEYVNPPLYSFRDNTRLALGQSFIEPRHEKWPAARAAIRSLIESRFRRGTEERKETRRKVAERRT